MSQPRRNWTAAHEKVILEGSRCRVCNSAWQVQCAHIIGRIHDAQAPLRDEGDWTPYTVAPDRIVPLCGPTTDPESCHSKYDDHKLNLLGALTPYEEAQAVVDAGSLEQARVRLAPLAYQNKVDRVPVTTGGAE